MHIKHASFILVVILPLVLGVAGCATGPSSTGGLQASLDTSHVPSGSDHGGLEDVHRLYRNGQFADALDGANYLVKVKSISPLALYYQAFLLRYRANVALGNFQDARRDYRALDAANWPEDVEVIGYYALVNALEGGDTSAEVGRLESMIASADARASTQAQNASLRNGWDQLMLRAEANYFLGLILVQRGDLIAAKTHFQKAQKDYQVLSAGLEGKLGNYHYDEVADSYRRIVATFLAVLNDDTDDSIARLGQLHAEAFYDPKAKRGIYDNLNWDMPYDPFLVTSSAAALKNRSFLAEQGNPQNIAAMIEEGRYLEAYDLLGKLYRSSRSDDSVRQLADVMSAYAPAEMTEEARRYLAQANVHIQRRDYQQGVSAYLQVIEQSPWLVDAYYNLAQIYAAAQDYRNAIRTMEHFLILSPNGPRSREARDSIYTWEVSGR